MGLAAQLACMEMKDEATRLKALTTWLERELKSKLTGVRQNAPECGRLPHVSSLSFAGVDSESLIMGLDDVAISNGSACTRASLEPSHVLRAIGLSDDVANSTVRLSLGRFTTREEVEYAATRIISTVVAIRSLTASYLESAGLN